MKISYGADHEFVPASHENPLDPGVWKKVLFPKADLQAGVVQMVNWARLGTGKHFAAHYHEDMQEIFIILQGEAHLTAGTQTVVLHAGDAARIDPHEVHRDVQSRRRRCQVRSRRHLQRRGWTPGGCRAESSGHPVVANQEASGGA